MYMNKSMSRFIVYDIEYKKLTLYVNCETNRIISMTYKYFTCPDSTICLMSKSNTNLELANLSWLFVHFITASLLAITGFTRPWPTICPKLSTAVV